MAENTNKAPDINKLLAEAKEEMGKILDAAKKEAADIVQTAKDEAAGLKAAAEEAAAAAAPEPEAEAAEDAANRQKRKDWLNELVSVKLYKDKNEYKDDVFVNVNGRQFHIKRGVEVMIPRKIAMVIEQSMSQAAYTADLIERGKADGVEAGVRLR